jgi:hypothetical protein
LLVEGDDARVAEALEQGALGLEAFVVIGAEADLEGEVLVVADDLEDAGGGALTEHGLDAQAVAEVVAALGLERGDDARGGGTDADLLEPDVDGVATVGAGELGRLDDRVGDVLGDVVGDGAGIEEAVAVEALLEVDAVLRGGVAGEQVEGEGAEAEEVGGDGVAGGVVEQLGGLVGGGGLGGEVRAVQGRRDVEAVGRTGSSTGGPRAARRRARGGRARPRGRGRRGRPRGGGSRRGRGRLARRSIAAARSRACADAGTSGSATPPSKGSKRRVGPSGASATYSVRRRMPGCSRTSQSSWASRVGLAAALEAGLLRGLARDEVGASAATHAGDLAVDGLTVLVAAAVVEERAELVGADVEAVLAGGAGRGDRSSGAGRGARACASLLVSCDWLAPGNL